jgi:hypothetical protein
MTKARFHFELFWPKFDDHDETIAQAWQQPIKASDPLARLDSMLRTMVQELQRWSTTRIGEIKAQLLMARELVLRLDTAQELQQLSKEESGLHRHMKMRCLGLSSLERTMLDRDRKSDSSVKGTQTRHISTSSPGAGRGETTYQRLWSPVMSELSTRLRRMHSTNTSPRFLGQQLLGESHLISKLWAFISSTLKTRRPPSLKKKSGQP